jgi:hypothetical protein
MNRLGVHWLDPLRPPLRRLERLGVVAPVPPYPPVFELENHRHVGYLTTAVVVDRLDDPKPVPDEHSTQPDGRRVGVSLVE